MHDDLATVVGDTSRVAAEDHGQPVGRQADSMKRPQIMTIEASGLHLDPHPAGGHAGRLDLTDDQGVQRRLRVRPDSVGRQHVFTLLGHDRCLMQLRGIRRYSA